MKFLLPAVAHCDLDGFLVLTRTRMHAAELPADDMSDSDVVRWALTPFCDRENARYFMTEPFGVGAWVYATDSRVAVRVPRPHGWTECDGVREKNVPPVTGVFYDRDPNEPSECWQNRSQPWPETPLVEDSEQCLKCHGYGVLGPRCVPCQQSGVIEDEHLPDLIQTKCTACDGHGRVGPGCDQCKGAGRYVYPAYRIVEGRRVFVRYDRLITTLPMVDVIKVYSNHRPLQFTFLGGHGIVMPADDPDPRES